jgi:hypothetical protein
MINKYMKKGSAFLSHQGNANQNGTDSIGRPPAQQTQSPEFKPQYYQKKDISSRKQIATNAGKAWMWGYRNTLLHCWSDYKLASH